MCAPRSVFLFSPFFSSLVLLRSSSLSSFSLRNSSRFTVTSALPSSTGRCPLQWDSNLAPGIGKIIWVSPLSGRVYSTGQSFHHAIPNVAHRRLTPVSAPAHHGFRVRPSVIVAEIDRISHKLRPSMAYQPAEDFLNDRSIVSFDDETRSIRAQTNALLRRIHAPLPRASKPLPVITNSYQYEEMPVTPRITSDAYIQRMLGHVRDVRRDVLTMSQYPEPAKAYIGRGHLACISYAGGRPVSRRRKLFHDDDFIKNEVTLLSHYDRMREAAKSPQVDASGDVSYSPLLLPLYVGETRREKDKPFESRFWKPSMPPRDPELKRVSAAAVEAVERQTALEREAKSALKQREKEMEREKKKEDERREEEREQRRMAEEAAAKQQKEKEAAEKKAAEEAAARKAEQERLEAERKAEEARLEAERKAKEEAERKAKEEAEKKAKEEAEKKAKEEAEKKAKEEAEKKAKEEAERKAKEEAERKAKEEAEKKAKEEAERLEAERKAKEEAERLEAERKAKEEEERKAKEEAEAAAAAAAAAEAEAAAAATAAAAAEAVVEPEATDGAPVEESIPVPSEPEPAPEGPEPTVEEPASPEAAAESGVESGPAIEEVTSGEEGDQ